MLELLSQASGFALFMAGLFTIGLTILAGAVTNAILKDIGFGVLPNGIISVTGVVTGIYVVMVFFG